ncbi:hypothetical protein N7468_004680 [Penicillium chermesinum]|uniref:Uncharacterized protein n=1 Tax=Penicillium chermesinum TaxID=63820 RepID=A0A9W9P8R4_9EURO|nr:uncharacterized protein N7468_004680 [Penicillium chermesinum]KAJ5240061.1 hypothetical protein N7468_004680 [Penicillium chermesinum]KAJ6166937.1 hypothetical protein N7470_002384 [Penicillium chermesinum]
MQSTISTIKVDPERRLSQYSLPDSSAQNLSQPHAQHPAKLRRRASQGSLRTKPSPVSRFLSKGSVAVHFPSWEHRSSSPGTPFRVESRNRSADSRLRLSTTVSRGPRPLTASSTSSSSSNSSWTSAAFQEYPTTLPPTPPDDDSPVAWNPRSEMLVFDTHKHPGPPMMHDGPGMDTPAATGPSDTLSSPSDGLSHGSSSSGGSPGPHDEMDCQQDGGSYLDHGINVTVSSLRYSNPRGEAVKIVSQTLPYPRTSDQSISLPRNDSVFRSIVQAVHNHLQPGQSPYINVTHAVPEQFSLSNLPHSPPSTPRSPTSADEYFNATIFSSAAVVGAYHDFRGPLQRQVAHTPMPIVPPHSVHISVLERYLPPASAQEYRDVFCPTRPSFLVDRMCELSPSGGTLLFIYPTKKGASTFKSQYLGPILDPLLRQLVVVNGLSADVGRYLGKLTTVSQMDDFATMKANIVTLCEALSSPSSRFHVADSGRSNAQLDRSLWAEWFIHQEKARMKEALREYWQNNRRPPVKNSGGLMSDNKEVTSAMLLSEIFDGIRKRRYGEDSEPLEGVELGVFIIQRTN